MSPELLQGDNASDPKIDIWALGVLMYAMIVGQYPFDGASRENIKDIVINQQVSFAHQKKILELKKEKLQEKSNEKEAASRPERVSILR